MLHHARLTRRRLLASALPAAVLGSLLTGCGGKPSDTSASGDGSSNGDAAVNVTANDFSFKFSTTTVPAGKVHFILTNQSKTYRHELWVYPQNQLKLQDMIAAKDSGQDVNEADYLQDIAGKVEDLDPGKSASFDTTLQPGSYEMACFIVTSIGGKNMVHYEMGMHGLLTVQ